MADPKISLEIQGLRKSFRGHLGIGSSLALSDLDLQVERGEIFGLLGPNGAGKTTTLKCVLGLLRPDRGEVRFFGRPTGNLEVRSKIGYLPENPYFYDYLTAREFLDFYGRLQGLAGRERGRCVERSLRRVGLGGRADTALRKFSKGMVQRLGLAQAIQHDPDLVILDEPMSGLDPLGRREVRDLILELRHGGKTVFFSSHILQDVEMICDRVAILEGGKLRSLGRLTDLVSKDVRCFEVRVRGELPDHVAAQRVTRSGDEDLVQVPDIEGLTRLLAAVAQTDARIVSVFPRQESLEDLFLRELQS